MAEAVFRQPWVKDVVIIGTTLAVLALIVTGYLALKPTLVLPPPSIISKCPARWVYNPETLECEPQGSTVCKPFNPDKVSDAEKCDIAYSCQTYWKGLCSPK